MRTTLNDPSVVIPAQVISNYVIVTAKWDRRSPYNFLIDTGGSVTLVSPTLAQRYGVPVRDPRTGKQVKHITCDPQQVRPRTSLDSTNLRRGNREAVFESVLCLGI